MFAVFIRNSIKNKQRITRKEYLKLESEILFLCSFLGGVTWELRVYLASDRLGTSPWIRQQMQGIRFCLEEQQ